jgi:predicted nucleic acid-binding protein
MGENGSALRRFSSALDPLSARQMTQAIGELFSGAAKSTRAPENTSKVERFAAGRAIVVCDVDVAREYGRLKQVQKDRGRPLPRTISGLPPLRTFIDWSS